MVGRIAMCSVGILVGLAGMRVQAQAPVVSTPANGAGCAQSVPVCAPAKPCRPCLWGPGIKGLFGGWCRPCRSPQPVACATCATAAAPAQPVRSVRVATPACATCAPACGCPTCVARRTPYVSTVIVNGSPAVSGHVASAYNTVPMPALSPAPQQGFAVPTTAAPPLAPPANPYATFIESVQTTQEKDARAIQEIVEHRQANLSLIRTMQAAEANTVASFEKLLNQMKEDSPKPAPIAAMPAAIDPPAETSTPPVVTLPAVPMIPVVPVSPAVVQVPTTIVPPLQAGSSAKEIQALMEELDRLAQKVKELNSQTQALPDK